MKVLEILGLLSKLTAIDKEDLEKRLTTNSKKDGDNVVLDRATVEKELETAFSAKFGSISDAQHKRGLREKGEEFEKHVTGLIGSKTDSKGVAIIADLVSHVESKASEGKGEKPTLTEKDIESNPLVRDYLKGELSKRTEAMKTQYGETISELETKVSGYKQKETMSVKEAQLLADLKEKKAALWDEKGNLIQKRWDTVKELYHNRKTAIIDGKVVPVDEKGEQLQDTATYNPITHSEFVAGLNPFGFHEHDPSKGSASPNSQHSNTPPSTSKNKFKSKAEYMSFITDASKSQEEKREAQKEWKASQAQPE